MPPEENEKNMRGAQRVELSMPSKGGAANERLSVGEEGQSLDWVSSEGGACCFAS